MWSKSSEIFLLPFVPAKYREFYKYEAGQLQETLEGGTATPVPFSSQQKKTTL